MTSKQMVVAFDGESQEVIISVSVADGEKLSGTGKTYTLAAPKKETVRVNGETYTVQVILYRDNDNKDQDMALAAVREQEKMAARGAYLREQAKKADAALAALKKQQKAA